MAIRARKADWPGKAKRVGVALAPLIVATAVVAVSLAVRVTTAVELDLTARAFAFTVGADPDDGERRFPVLDNATVFSTLTVEDCGTVSFPQLLIGPDGAPPMPSGGAVAFRCDATVPGAKVRVRADPPQELGIAERVMARRQDRIALELTSVTPPGIRMRMAGDIPFNFSLRRQVPFAIDTEFAEVAGFTVPAGAGALASYHAELAESSASRQVQAKADGLLSVVIELAGAEGVASLFTRNVDIPLESISLFQRSDVDDAFESTVLDGQLRYTSTQADSVAIDDGDTVRFRGADGLRLTGLIADAERSGLKLTLEGDAEEISTNGTDRRIRLFDRVVSDRTRGLAAIIAVLASQLVWLRQQWGAGRKA